MNKQIAYDFVHAINEHNIDMIYALMANDFKFIDAYGGEEVGKEHMKNSWMGYFKWFPDYKIEIEDTLINDNCIVILGFASGTFEKKVTSSNENYWRLPASWKIVVENDKIKLWQVFCDSKIPFEIIMKNTNR